MRRKKKRKSKNLFKGHIRSHTYLITISSSHPVMATRVFSQMCSNSLLLLLIIFATFYSSSIVNGGGHEADNHHHVVNVQSLLPKENCSPSQESDPSKLKVVHRHGPCSPIKHKRKHTHKTILNNDQIRVDWLQTKASTKSTAAISDRLKSKPALASSKIPAKKGIAYGTGNYIVEIGIGTPKTPQSVVFDTGSDVTWVQCQPCVSQCYDQQDQIFDPSKSSTYSNISCTSQYCSSLDISKCAGPNCLYGVQYGDSSYTVGFYAQDTLTLGTSETVPNFRFGCGEKNNGLFGRAAGLMGLGRKQSSIVMQTSQKYGGVFAYCLPTLSSSVGYLTFGRSGPISSKSNVQFTPMLSNSNKASFYFLELMSISVGGQKLEISPALFSKAGAIVDSGTVITRMPPTAYSALKSAFKSRMTQYPAGPEAQILDTCYDLSNYTTVQIPTVALEYRGATMNLDPTGIVYVLSQSQVCLGFAPNSDDSGMMIIGNTQQRRFNIVYDVSNKMIGFGAKAC